MSIAVLPIAIRVSIVALPKCGKETTFSNDFYALGRFGSVSNTSRAAPAISFEFRAWTNAFSSIISPLAVLITKADLNWAEAQKYLDTPSWKKEIENNRIQLIASGLWGVPSFRLINNNEEIFVTWGRDRIWLLKHHIKMALI